MKPIAIVGIGCRFPGSVSNPTDLWSLLEDGRDAITEIPRDRFDIDAVYAPEPRQGRLASRYGGFVDDVWDFDSAFFRISPREAMFIDPQQRLLLHTVREALEDAGIPLSSLAGSMTGVFVGLHRNEYAQRCELASLDLTSLTGSARSGAAGRISYALNLSGPAMVLDTDRSSGLVAVHSACMAIANDDCDLAIVGAANLVLDPNISIAFSAAGLLAPDGRCKFADSRANGFVRSEGVAVVVLRSLDAALAESAPIYAVIRGSAAQASGNSSGDPMTPSSEAQAALIDLACRRAGASPGDILYVEAHGTGTPVGDRAELQALARVVGSTKRQSPCWVGSIKSNIGHSEACAGLAGLIKVALAAHRRAIPASLHFREFHPSVASRDPGLRVPTSLQLLPKDVEFLAGVSSFGLTGINAHAIVAGPPPPAVSRQFADGQPLPICSLSISANHRNGLRELAGRYASLLGDAAVDLDAVCHSAAVHRAHLRHRASFVSRSRSDLIASLESFSQGSSPESAFISGKTSERRTQKLVFVFPGQGSQWVGMGRELLSSNRVFAETFERAEPLLRRLAGWSPIDELLGEPRVDQHDIVQPLLFVMEVALSAMWMSWGIVPSAVVGTSMGEVAAAHVAGALDLEDSLEIMCHRSRLMRTIVGKGSTALVELPVAQVIARLHDERVSIAAVNGPSSTLISGDRSAIDAAMKAFEADKVFVTLVRVGLAAHCSQVDPILPSLADALNDLSPRDGKIPFYSTVHPGPMSGARLDADYWVKNLREPVNLAGAVQRLLSDGHDIFVEVSPHPILRAPLLDCIDAAAADALVLGTLRRDEDDVRSAFESLARLHVSGYPVDWSRILPRRPFHKLPLTPWQTSTYRVESTTDAVSRPSIDPGPPPAASHSSDSVGRSLLSPSLAPTDTLIQRLHAAAPSARLPIVTDVLRAELASVLRSSVDTIDLDAPFRDLGLTSLAGTEFRIAIGALLNRTYSSTLLFNHSNLNALAAYICAELEPSPDNHLDRAKRRTASLGDERGQEDPKEDVSDRLSERVDSVLVRRSVATVRQHPSGLVNPSDDPVAIVGIALRFPGGVHSRDQLWDLLEEGRDTIGEIPSDRWDASRFYDPNPRTPGKMHTRWGSFVDDIGHFDPAFFGISPREAESMDPQQRVLLDLSWVALESAGIPRSRLMGSSTGVFAGIMNTNEYARRKDLDRRLERVTPHTSTGDAMSVAAGRISYFFGLRGPAITIDTACSSSLVALHLAVSSLRIGECRAALVGGVNLIASPSTTMSFAKTRMLSPRGRCRPFDVSADGYVRAEGGCVLVVKRLSDAVADNDRILAVVRGTAVNHDGRSSGLTVPNGIAQKALIERALDCSGTLAAEVSYVEAHGTGTPLGDPIEVQAVADVFRDSHGMSNPLYLGAVKANLGHMEACAGLAGIAKVIVAMEHRSIPRQINLERVNPDIGLPDWIDIPRETQSWSPPGKRLIAGVSSFGFSGTNAHVILEAHESQDPDVRRSHRDAPVVCLSALTRESLRSVARRLAGALPDVRSAADANDLAYSSACRREHFRFRAAFVPDSGEQILHQLEAVAEGRASSGLFSPKEVPHPPRVGFLYSAPDSRSLAVGRVLYEKEPVFRAAFDECAKIVDSKRKLSLSASMFGPRVDWRNVALHGGLFALQYALTVMWAAWGVTPFCVIGHGLGEYAAAHAAGTLDLESALSLVLQRGELLDGLRDPGLVARLQCEPELADELITPLASDVAIAAYDAPNEILVAGRAPALQQLLSAAAAKGIRASIMDGVVGAHSPIVDEIAPQIAEGAGTATFSMPRIAFVSAVTGRLASDEPTKASYWSRLVREPVRFADGIRSMVEAGCNTFVEIGPRDTLLRLAQETVGEGNRLWIPSLDTERPDLTHTSEVLAQLFANGVSVDWDAFYRGHEGRSLELPPYPLARRRFWVDDTPSSAQAEDSQND